MSAEVSKPTAWLASESNERNDVDRRMSWGREYLVESERSERLYLVTRDSFRAPQQRT